MTGGLANAAAEELDPFIRGARPATAGDVKAKQRIPVVGPAIARFTGSNVNQEELTAQKAFYDKQDLVTQAIKTLQTVKGQGDPVKLADFMQKNASLLAQKNISQSFSEKVGKLNSLRNKILQAPDIDEKTRRENLAALAKAKIELMQAYNSIK